MREEEEEVDDDDGTLAEVDDNLVEVLVEHGVRDALLSRWVEREALAPLLVSGSQICALLVSGQAERAAERLRVVVEASLRWFRMGRSEVRRLLCVLVEIVLLVASSGLLLLEAHNSSESESDKSQFDLCCCACLRCFGDDGIFPRSILLGIAWEWLLLVAVVAVAVVAVVVLLLLCKLHDMTSEHTVVNTWCVRLVDYMYGRIIEAIAVHSCERERERRYSRGFVNGASLFRRRTCWLQCGSLVGRTAFFERGRNSKTMRNFHSLTSTDDFVFLTRDKVGGISQKNYETQHQFQCKSTFCIL